MLILASNTSKLQVTVQNASTIDVHASWMDNVAGAVGPGRTNTPSITTATTVDVVGAPALGPPQVQRNVKTLHVRNRGASSAGIIVTHTDGTVPVAMQVVTLPPGATLQYIDEVGFLPVLGGRP